MNNLPRILSLLLATMLLGACGIYGDKDDEDLEPKELVDFNQTLKVKKVWSDKIGGFAELQRVSLLPVCDGNRIFAASTNCVV